MKSSMQLSLLIFGIMLVVNGQHEDDEWIDPTDMLNYDAASVSMRKPEEREKIDGVNAEMSSKREIASCPEVSECMIKLKALIKECEEYKKEKAAALQKGTCNPVFKRYLNKLLLEIGKLGFPDANNVVHYDAEVILSRQAVSEIKRYLNDENWKSAAMDDALGEILVNFKYHDYEAWKWKAEDVIGVDIPTLLMLLGSLACITIIITTEVWTQISWFAQFKRAFVICFLISFVWNWLYLYKIAFADHQANIAKMNQELIEKCDGLQKITWQDSLYEWLRSTWTLQDDPCKVYYEVLLINPILLVPPIRPLSHTFTTFITEPMKQVGKGIGEFIKALLKDLPIQLQVPVFCVLGIAVIGFCYASGMAVGVLMRQPIGNQAQLPPAIPQHNVPQLQHNAGLHQGGGDADYPSRRGNSQPLNYETGDLQQDCTGRSTQRRPDKQPGPQKRGRYPENIGATTRSAEPNIQNQNSEGDASLEIFYQVPGGEKRASKVYQKEEADAAACSEGEVPEQSVNNAEAIDKSEVPNARVQEQNAGAKGAKQKKEQKKQEASTEGIIVETLGVPGSESQAHHISKESRHPVQETDPSCIYPSPTFT
ncbi:chloride channel CLIC-like protein 1 isoform X2 [Latimeria chalumnae]|uniref:chloride channel CLIC-like protein 1 isoform X2 n=1 Tax=Latimeria chalumnae TaxID=7897 RepID=UPI0006D91D62|nr:PREDICTED: chloride channel CLIC-like protein 1 [Latimeria chalumnae]|eukprot:XP_014344964.1 PREDICTED: chloride channel CLIC-like protein 1 [Latimeria chalumnae]